MHTYTHTHTLYSESGSSDEELSSEGEGEGEGAKRKLLLHIKKEKLKTGLDPVTKLLRVSRYIMSDVSISIPYPKLMCLVRG